MSNKDYWCDGHFISAESFAGAREECLALYGHSPEVVRRWTDADQARLDWETHE